MWLDLGCGGSPRGNFNLDLFHGDSPHTVQKIDAKKINNFTLGDASILPYRDNMFVIVSAYHLIEHLLVPTDCIKEMVRVSSKYVVVVVPNHPIMNEHHEHMYSWSKSSLECLLSSYGKLVYSDIRLIWWNSRKAFGMIERIRGLMLRRLLYRMLDKLFGTERIVIIEVDKNV